MNQAQDISRFPEDGWRYDGSYSYGQAELYYAIPRVVVRMFGEPDKRVADAVLSTLREAGVKTSRLTEAQHTDGRKYFYVFAERGDFLLFRDRFIPHVQISD